MDTRTDAYTGYRHTSEPQPVAVTRWTARLADPQVEHDYRIDRFPEDKRRVVLLLVLASIASGFNFVVLLYSYYLGGSGAEALVPPFAAIWLPLLGLAIINRIPSPVVLETTMLAFMVVGVTTRMTIMTLYPTMAFLWPTLIIAIIFVTYVYLPVRFIASATLAIVFTAVAVPWWLFVVKALLPFDQMLRVLVWLVFANALGFIAANSIQRGQRERYAQSLLLKELLSTDAMTGIGNRRRFDDALDREWRRCSRSGKPLSLIMVDVDHFKAYNDYHGHLQGDECLRQVARLMVGCVGRPGDLVARYGGEEFVCLLPEVNAEGARAVAVKFVMAIARGAIPHGALPNDGRLTISVGVATSNNVSQQTPAGLVALADGLLYDAKRAGRDQIMTGML